MCMHCTNLPYDVVIAGCHLFCTSCLDGNFLRVALAVKTKVYMWFWKHPALPASQQGPPSPIENHIKSFVKSKVRIFHNICTVDVKNLVYM